MTKEEFLKEFDKYSDKFLDAIPINAMGHGQWMMFSDDFGQFVVTGKLPNQLDEEAIK